MIVTPDKEVCNISFEYDYEWKVFDGQFPLHYEDECKLKYVFNKLKKNNFYNYVCFILY